MGGHPAIALGVTLSTTADEAALTCWTHLTMDLPLRRCPQEDYRVSKIRARLSGKELLGFVRGWTVDFAEVRLIGCYVVGSWERCVFVFAVGCVLINRAFRKI